MRVRSVRKIIIGLFLLMFVFSLFVCILTRKSLVNNLSPRPYIDSEEYDIFSIPDMNNNYMQAASIRSYLDLMEASDLVVRLKVNDENERYYHTGQTVTEAEVLETYKGTSGEQIYILEPIAYDSGSIISTENYYWIRDNEEYIIFLKQYNDIHLGKETKIYIPTSAGYGQYCITKDYETCKISNESSFDTEKYHRIREQIIDLF